jgi:hypothetical protein
LSLQDRHQERAIAECTSKHHGQDGMAERNDGYGRAADAAGGGWDAGERRPIAVVWDKRLRRPTLFVWRRRRYRVERVVHTWVVDTGWWDDSVHISRRYCRVRADGRLFDIYFDRLSRAWFLEKTLG